jgi:thiamine transport system ATP-binding protein
MGGVRKADGRADPTRGGLVIRDLRVELEGRTILDGVDLEAPEGQVTAVLGASGSGKTTILRAVAGLVEVAAGSILVAGRDVTGLPTHRRGVGLMFQDLALFPHLDVGANVGFGLGMQGVSSDERSRRVAEGLELVGLEGTVSRAVQTLSGGERQRVALARALAPAPSVLMLDEPLGAIDRTLRDRLLDELAAIVDAVGVTTLYVTHDQSEAFRLAAGVAIVRDGRIVQFGDPHAVWSRPTDEATARLLGHRNVVRDGERTILLRADGLTLSRDTSGTTATGGTGVTRGAAAEPVKIAAASFDGGVASIRVVTQDGTELALTQPSRERWRTGDVAMLRIDPDARIELG